MERLWQSESIITQLYQRILILLAVALALVQRLQWLFQIHIHTFQ